ncbi:MAG: phage late control D family protein [Lachnospiraceae bacterium]|nr:phage late control D family protein [Lachnospiraceae bacterium]
MTDAVTYENLLLRLGQTSLSVYHLNIVEEPGGHGRMTVEAETEEGAKDYLLYEEYGSVVLYADMGESLQPLFYGIVTRMEVAARGGRCEISLEAVTQSYMMDLSVRNCSFQDVAMTSHQLMKGVMESYSGSQALISVPDEALGHIAIQYQETDWDFVKRMLSDYGAAVYVDSTMPGICLRMGLMEEQGETDWDSLPYTVMRDTAPENVQKERKGQMCYIVEANDLFPLGQKVQFRGQELYIGKVSRYISRGVLINEYRLYFREGMAVLKYNNPFLCGVSLYGVVTEVKRSRIRAALETDTRIPCQNSYFYAYSTVAASPDGSGWYCMPKPGDSVRIFFPSDDEREGYAVSNTVGQSSPGQDSPISNPDLKDLVMPDGKGVKFIENGIQMCVGDFKGSAVLTNDGKIQIEVQEEKDIKIYSEGLIHFLTEDEGQIETTAGTKIQITNDAGGEICMTDNTILIKASVIENN